MATSREDYEAELRAKGVPDDVIETLLSSMPDPTDIARQYAMTKYLREGALGSGSKNVFGAAAQGLMGYMAGTADKKYEADIQAYRDFIKNKRAAALRAQFPRMGGSAGQDMPDMGMSDYSPKMAYGQEDELDY